MFNKSKTHSSKWKKIEFFCTRKIEEEEEAQNHLKCKKFASSVEGVLTKSWRQVIISLCGRKNERKVKN